MSAENVFSRISDDVVLNIFSKLEDDPRNWSRLACVSPKFSALIRTVCLPTKCSQTIPSLVSNLLPSSAGWASLYKLSVCCPGLLYSGVLLENSDFGLERELGPDEEYRENKLYIQSCHQQQPQPATTTTPAASSCCTSSVSSDCTRPDVANDSDCSWSLYDDLYFDTVYNASESSLDNAQIEVPQPDVKENVSAVKPAREFSVCKRRKICRSLRSHLASGVWNLSREQGNKLLASRFRGDCLYICDWPGCVHIEEKRNYMLFRGIFKNFKKSRVWRTINDGNRSKVDLNCAYCPSKQVWDLHSAFCLRPGYGFHDDGEPVVRAYVCENGHVSGAWTDWPLYT